MPARLSHLIDGEDRPARTDAELSIVEPATSQTFATCPDGEAIDVEAAFAAAHRAFPSWSRVSSSERAGWLNRLADALQSRIEDFAQAESRDAGKPLSLARDVEIPRAIANLRFFAAAAMQFASESHHGQAGLN